MALAITTNQWLIWFHSAWAWANCFNELMLSHSFALLLRLCMYDLHSINSMAQVVGVDICPPQKRQNPVFCCVWKTCCLQPPWQQLHRGFRLHRALLQWMTLWLRCRRNWLWPWQNVSQSACGGQTQRRDAKRETSVPLGIPWKILSIAMRRLCPGAYTRMVLWGVVWGHQFRQPWTCFSKTMVSLVGGGFSGLVAFIEQWFWVFMCSFNLRSCDWIACQWRDHSVTVYALLCLSANCFGVFH